MKKKFIILIALGVLLTGAAAWLVAAPTIGAISVSPTSIEVGTTTSITVTAAISDPSVISTGVNLLRVGTPTTIIGQFKDDGTNGDAKAGDKIFTARLSITAQTVGETQYQVSAAFRGQLMRVTAPLVITVAPKGVTLPRDPGEAGKQTVAGIDSDHNGVRDDLDRYIAFTYPTSATKRAALLQDAKALHSFVVTGRSDDDLVYAQALNVINAKYCMFTQTGHADGIRAHTLLKAEVLNTKARSVAFIEADKKLSGKNFGDVPEGTWRSLCQFDPVELEN